MFDKSSVPLFKHFIVQLKHRIFLKYPGIRWYTRLLNENTPYTFTRYGDGEWSAILGCDGKNCDGHEYFPEMGEALRNTLKNPHPYIYSLQPLALKVMGKQIRKFITVNNIEIKWHCSDVFHLSNKFGLLYPFVESLRKKKVVIVGPEHLRRIKSNVVDYSGFIEVPSQNCFTASDDIKQKVYDYFKKNGPAVFAFSASMPAKTIIYDLYPSMGAECWLLDLGSLWDIYAGVKSRTYFKKPGWDKKVKKNLGVLSKQ